MYLICKFYTFFYIRFFYITPRINKSIIIKGIQMFTLALRFIFLRGTGVVPILLISPSPIWLQLTFPVMDFVHFVFRIVLSLYPKSLNVGLSLWPHMMRWRPK